MILRQLRKLTSIGHSVRLWLSHVISSYQNAISSAASATRRIASVPGFERILSLTVNALSILAVFGVVLDTIPIPIQFKGLLTVLCLFVALWILLCFSTTPATSAPSSSVLGFVRRGWRTIATIFLAILPIVATPIIAVSVAEFIKLNADATANTYPICGGQRLVRGNDGRNDATLGVAFYTTEQNDLGMSSNAVRAVAVDPRGVWFGYYPGGTSPIRAMGQFDRTSWEQCTSSPAFIGQNVNDIAVTANGDVWVATDGFGVSRLRDGKWESFTYQNGLIDDRTYTVVADNNGNVFVGTWEGVAEFQDGLWQPRYREELCDISNGSHIHSILFHPNEEIWIGEINGGISRFTRGGIWECYSQASTPEGLASDAIRGFSTDHDGNVWIATDGGGVSFFNITSQTWQLYLSQNSDLPDNHVRDIAVDKSGRPWAATQSGVVYFDGVNWIPYLPIDTFSIAFGPACEEDCPYDDDHMWLGTVNYGLIHARIPSTSNVVRLLSLDFPRVVMPGERFSPRITVRVLPEYYLAQDRGDMLRYVEGSLEDRFGAHEFIPVIGFVNAGDDFEFVDFEHPLIAPQVRGIYQVTLRIWWAGRYVGETITIEFVVI